MTNQEKIDELNKRLIEVSRKQEDFAREINAIRRELYQLQAAEFKAKKPEKEISPIVETVNKPLFREKVETIVQDDEYIDTSASEEEKTVFQPKTSFNTSLDLEKFIGENLLSKIGIIITIIGVAIGAKYSLDNDLISPLARIILGYVMGLGLLGTGIRLKSKYEDYSAVLVSGGMSVIYFITFMAYSYYGLIGKYDAFGMMVFITILTVLTATRYNREIIALIGLVGAYAVPFFLSDGSGDVRTMFIYMAIINIGILVIAFKRYWKLLYYSAFAVTWLIYLIWVGGESFDKSITGTAMLYGTLFFAIFYATFLAYKLIEKEKFDTIDVILLLLNSFIYYGVGYAVFEANSATDHLLGLFTLGNAVLHSVVSFAIYRQRPEEENLLYFTAGLMLVFLTIAIPIQLGGMWIVLLWTALGVVLFWIGRTRNIPFYEGFSYVHILLGSLSLVVYWLDAYGRFTTPIFNVYFLTTFLFILAIGYLNWLNFKSKYANSATVKSGFMGLMTFALPSIFLLSLYFMFRLEIGNVFQQSYERASEINNQNYHSNRSILIFKDIWQLNYSLLFIILLAFFNIKKLKSDAVGSLNIILNILGIVVFLTMGLELLNELQEHYINKIVENNTATWWNIGIRYVSYAFLIGVLYTSYKYILSPFVQWKDKRFLDIGIHLILLIVLSFELISWLESMNNSNADKLGLSILWGIYALSLIGLGIWKRQEHLRFGAIALFAVTLFKLFFYDIAHLDTISKTIVFVVIGLLLLLVSFLYNKYKDAIVND